MSKAHCWDKSRCATIAWSIVPSTTLLCTQTQSKLPYILTRAGIHKVFIFCVSGSDAIDQSHWPKACAEPRTPAWRSKWRRRCHESAGQELHYALLFLLVILVMRTSFLLFLLVISDMRTTYIPTIFTSYFRYTHDFPVIFTSYFWFFAHAIYLIRLLFSVWCLFAYKCLNASNERDLNREHKT